METEIQRFERLCRSVGIHINVITFIAKPDDVFNLFRATVKDCEQQQRSLINKTIELVAPEKHAYAKAQKILDVLTLKNKFCTAKEINEDIKLKERTLYDYLSRLVKENLVEIDTTGQRKMWKLKDE